MKPIYRLQTITAMKLQCMRQLTIEIETSLRTAGINTKQHVLWRETRYKKKP